MKAYTDTGSKVHIVHGVPGFVGLFTLCGHSVGGYLYVQETEDPVTCRTCLRLFK